MQNPPVTLGLAGGPAAFFKGFGGARGELYLLSLGEGAGLK